MSRINRYTAALLLALAFHACLAKDGRRYHFDKCNYDVAAAFTVLCPKDSALAACFAYRHLKRFLMRSNLCITPVAEGKQWSRYVFAYSYVVYRCSLAIRYDLKPDSNIVRYNLYDTRPVRSLFPLMQELSGCYRVDPVPGSDSVRVTYLQRARMSKRLNIIYTTEIKFETDGVIKRLKSYLENLGRKSRFARVE
jgi:hypothetical protein